jgi:uncharacterized protein YjbI with pentapeptide repeats
VLDFQNVDLSHADLRGVNYAGADFTNAILDGTNFSGATLTGARFVDCNLSSATFSQDASFGQKDRRGLFKRVRFKARQFKDWSYLTLTDVRIDGTGLAGLRVIEPVHSTRLASALLDNATRVRSSVRC